MHHIVEHGVAPECHDWDAETTLRALQVKIAPRIREPKFQKPYLIAAVGDEFVI